ncbi:MAG: hypothetical protein U1F67_09985 [Rubrivivax sp.]
MLLRRICTRSPAPSAVSVPLRVGVVSAVVGLGPTSTPFTSSATVTTSARWVGATVSTVTW